MTIAGIVSASLFVLGVLAVVLAKIIDWRKRWGHAVGLGGALVRVEELGIMPAHDLDIGNRVILSFIRERFGKDVLEFRVDVWPDNRMTANLGGISFTERAFPLTPLIYVARVQTTQAPYYVAHEVARHLLPLVMVGHSDPHHMLVGYRPIEDEIKARMKEAGIR